MVKKKIKTEIKDYFTIEYLKETKNMFKMKEFRCINCLKTFRIKYDKNNVPLSLWCEKCRSLENKIKTQFKMKNTKNKKDPYVTLAELQVLLDKSKKYWEQEADGTNSIILSEIIDILKKAKIPEKYLIAESLD